MHRTARSPEKLKAWRIILLSGALFIAMAPAVAGVEHSPPDLETIAAEAAVAGTWEMVDYAGSSPRSDILCRVNEAAEAGGVPDTDKNPEINDHILVYYIYADGNCVPLGQLCWELHAGPDVIPAGARGLQVDIAMEIPSSRSTRAEAEEWSPTTIITGTARARYVPDGGILPIAANEYWLGSQSVCPYAHCGEPYSFVRNPAQPPPFASTDGGLTWQRNVCPDPYNGFTCQGPYEGAGENLGRAFALLGGDAKPNDGSVDPRGGVMLDLRYDALKNYGYWHLLVGDDQWQHNVPPVPSDQGREAMATVIQQGGYEHVPLPGSVHGPPVHESPEYHWGYCWGWPAPDTCFNYPLNNRSVPYDVLQFLNGVDGTFLATAMYDAGSYVGGRYAPGERIIVMVYNGSVGAQWGSGPNKDDAAVIVGYAGVTIVGYGNHLASPCSGTPGDWQSYAACVQGTQDTVYGLVERPLVMDPTALLWEWLPKRVELLTPPAP